MGAETYNVRVLYSRKRKLIYQKWYLNLDTTRCTHAQTTAMGTGAFVVACAPLGVQAAFEPIAQGRERHDNDVVDHGHH